MAEVSQYPTVSDIKSTDQFLTWRSSDGQVVKVPWSVILAQLPRSFLTLTDTPGTYLGQAGKTLAVTTGEDSLEFVPNNLSPTFQTLPDTPSYAGNALKKMRVNAGETALEAAFDTFLENTDTPSSYTGKALQLVRVNAGENALEFVGGDVAIPNVVLVDEEADLPPVNGSGEHELAANTAYWFTGSMNLANPIRFTSPTSTIYGNSSSQSIIAYTGTGYAIRAGANTIVQMRDIRIDSSADGIQLLGGGGSGSQDSVLLSNMAVIAASGRALNIDNPDQLVIDGCFFLGAQGLLISGANVNLATLNRSVFQITTSNNVIDFGTAVLQVAVVDACSIIGAAGAVAIAGLAASGNLSTTGSGRVSNCTVAQGVTATSGVSTEDLRWRFESNIRIADSNTVAFAYITTPATTIISSPGVDTPVAGTWTAAAATERATVSAAGVITFDNVEEEKGLVNVTFTAEKIGGGLGDYIFKVQKDSGGGYIDVEAITKTVELSTTTSSITLMGITNYVDGDDFRLVVRGVGTSDDVNVAVTQFVIGS